MAVAIFADHIYILIRLFLKSISRGRVKLIKKTNLTLSLVVHDDVSDILSLFILMEVGRVLAVTLV